MSLKISEGQKLITSGPYRWVKHPSYIGYLMFVSGMPWTIYRANGPMYCMEFIPGVVMFLQKWFRVAFSVWALVFKRIPVEEKLLVKSFPNDWPAYSKRTKKLIPGVF